MIIIKRFKNKFIILLSINFIGIICLIFIILKNPMPALISFNIAIFIILFILYYDLFCKYTTQYPKNNKEEFKYNPKKSTLGYQSDGDFIIKIIETSKGIWVAEDENEKMKFDMSGYIFPKSYICSYFIRNLHYDVINKNKYPLRKLFKSLNLSPFNKFQNVSLRFEYKNKITDIVIVKNNTTKVSFLMRQILESRYGLSLGMNKAYNGRLFKYDKIDENIYEREKIRDTIFIKKKK